MKIYFLLIYLPKRSTGICNFIIWTIQEKRDLSNFKKKDVNFKLGWFIVVVISFFFKNETATHVESIKLVCLPDDQFIVALCLCSENRMFSFRRQDRILKSIVRVYFLTFIVLNVFTTKLSLAERKSVAGKQKFS